MRRIATALALIPIAVLGCRSPQTVLQTLQRCDPCFVDSVPNVCAPKANSTESASIEQYVQLGLSSNPRIQEARHKIAAIRQRAPQVLSLPDPMVNTNTWLAPVQTAAGEQAFSLGVSQKFTNAEKRATQVAIVSDEVAAAEAALLQAQLEIAESIRTACYQLLLVRKSVEITNQDRETLGQIGDVVLRQYEVKKSVSQQDVLNVQTEQSLVENQITELRQKEKSLQARLARLLNADPVSSLQIEDSLECHAATLDPDELIAAATRDRPDLQSQLALIRRDRKKIHLAKLEEKPDFTVGLNWIATAAAGNSPVANGDDALLLGVGFNLPINGSRIRAGICESQANWLAATNRLDSLQDLASEEIVDLVVRLESTGDTLNLIQQDIIPKAERTLDISIDEFATSSNSYGQLIENWRRVLRYRITEANLQSQYLQLLASLARSAGQLAPIQSQTTGNSGPRGIPDHEPDDSKAAGEAPDKTAAESEFR